MRFRTNQDETKWRLAVEQHGQMMLLLAQRDGPALGHLLADHLRHKRDTVLNLMRNGQANLGAFGAQPSAAQNA